ncbi:UNVERIFIED_CONTAM: hypothetical protein PYX00_011218 [Menopon gallinae]|uniref:Serine hydroxymethyltransferase n=1 Tax=Menopon gallinae TaxID=328185 RepID=A0AAW2H6U9_9NEOP
MTLQEKDPIIANLIDEEENRQIRHIELIASENFVSQAVLQATGSVLTNKYAEGYPGARYYGGCEVVDKVESLAQERLKQLFGVEYANKPKLIIAGASSYSRFVHFKEFYQIAQEVGAYLMCDIAHIAGPIVAGLHPTPVGCSHFITSTTHKTLRGPRGGIIMMGKDFENWQGVKTLQGRVKKTSELVNSAVIPGTQGGPLLHVIAAKAVAFKEALSLEFKRYQKQVLANAKHMAKVFSDLGYRVVSGGTDNHLFCLDLRSKAITGRDAEKKLNQVGITLNKNAIPFDTTSPFVTSGIRIGTPAMTTRGLKEIDMEKVANLIHEVLECQEEKRLTRIKQEIGEWMQGFPMPD